MALKALSDFHRYLTIGAVAADAVRQDLEAHGHRVIELERNAMTNKIWYTNVKRLRLPDLLCVRCGRRVESRGKSNLGIVVSHSDAPDRGWDGGGLRDDDLFAFLRVDLSADPPRTGQPAYFSTSALRTMRDHATESNRKAISEGAELTLEWKASMPGWTGKIVGVDDQGRLIGERADGSRSVYWQWRDWPAQHRYVADGGAVVADETIVAGIVEPPDTVDCPGDTWDVAASIEAGDAAERYAGVRAAGVLGMNDVAAALQGISENDDDWRLRLEATAALARLDPDPWTDVIAALAHDDADDQQRMEAVFVLSEIATDEATAALHKVAAPGEGTPTEVRSAAVWGLARGVFPRPELVVPFVADDEDEVALHAITGLSELPEDLIPMLVDWLAEDDRRAAAAAQVLLRHRAIRPLLEGAARGDPGRSWALRALGDVPPDEVRSEGAVLLTPETEETLTAIWIGQRDWLRNPGQDGIEALDLQKVRFSPLPD